jgi:multiple sugar transport system permease protein
MKKSVRNDLSAIPFLLPFFVLYAIFTLWPMGEGIYISLYKWTLVRKIKFVGLDNYARMIKDPQFWDSMWHTFYFVIVSTPIIIVLALLLAIICNQNSRFKKFFRVAFFLPNILSVAVISYIAIFMLQPYTGFINTFIHSLGFKAEPFWLADVHLAWVSIIGTTLWWTVGFDMILFLSALQNIPDELYEASEIDGATRTKKFFHITLPLLKPMIKIILLLQIIGSFKVFAQPWLITRGGPGNATRPIIQYIYETGFNNANLGYASTLSYALFLILVICTLIQLKFTGKEE